MSLMSPPEDNPALEAVQKALRYWTQPDLARRLGVDPRTVRRWVLGEVQPKYSVAKAIEYELARDERPRNPSFTFIDRFAGIGGLRRGFEAHNGRCVFTSEWDPHAARTYKANFPDADDIYGDITMLPPADVPDHDVLLAGFPCQPFSLAGVSKKNSLGREHGFRDKTQGTLFFNVVKILEAKRPKAFLLENVKNLKSHDGTRTYRVIMGALRELGYQLFDRVIDARPWVPQRRERIFIVGFAENVHFSFDDMRRPKRAPTLADILHQSEEEPESPFTLTVRGKTIVDPRYTLSDHLWKYLQDYASKHRAKGNGFGCSVFGKDDVARTLSARYHKDGSEILIAQPRKNPRRLTPRECARLMGFDALGGRRMTIPVSDTQAYRQFGNSVVVPLVDSIAEVMIPRVLAPEAHPPINSEQREIAFDEQAA